MKIAAYIRVSTKEQDTERQKNLIRDYLSKNYGYTDTPTYFEEKQSGKSNEERDEFKRFLSIADYDLAIVADLSRLSRCADVDLTAHQICQLIQRVTLVILTERGAEVYEKGSRLPDNLGKFITLIVGLKAVADERLWIRKRMKSGKQTKLKEGKVVGSLPFGYNQDGTAKPEEAEVVRYLFEQVAKGVSIAEVEKQLKLQGKLSKTNLCTTLKKTTYYGEHVVNFYPDGVTQSEIRRNKVQPIATGVTKVEPIISKELYELANSKVKQNRSYYQQKGLHYLSALKGLVACPNCGKNLYYAVCRGIGHYQCNDCKSYVGASVLHSIIYTLLHDSVEGLAALEACKVQRLSAANEEVSLFNQRRETLRGERAAVEAEKGDILKQVAKLTNASLLQAIEARLNTFDKKIQALQAEEEELCIRYEQQKEAIRKSTVSAEDEYTFLHNEISRIEVTKYTRKISGVTVRLIGGKSLNVYYLPYKNKAVLVQTGHTVNKLYDSVTITFDLVEAVGISLDLESLIGDTSLAADFGEVVELQLSAEAESKLVKVSRGE